ncbi:MAG: NADH-ubiquinone oxidoreductase-F iron-sulfur binding region domain-containing protein [Acidimicrobiales bacterium]
MVVDPVLLPGAPVPTLDAYVAGGGGEGLALARTAGPGHVISELTLSRLRGRGGGGFPTGRKWAGIRDAGPGRRFVVCNAAEGEPGTFKDRALIRHNPYQVLEGLAIAVATIGAEAAYVATKASYRQEADRLRTAIEETSAAGWFDALPVTLVLGPEEYLFGEEKGLLEVIEGRDPLPRVLPPFQHGLFATDVQAGWEATDSGGDAPDQAPGQANPTLVNNAETLANVPHILTRRPEWFRSLGTDQSPGTIIATVTGDVVRPLVVEVEMGTTLEALIDLTGGAVPGRSIQAVVNGVANGVLTATMLDVRLDYEDLAAVGSGLGSAGFVVYDDTACPVELARALSRFLYVESCGQCRSCKFGCGEITRALETISAGSGTDRDVAVIGERLRTVTDQTRCYLATEEQVLIASILERFAEEFAVHLEGRCSKEVSRPMIAPKIVDLLDGVVTWDDHQTAKQPDWTYRAE